MPTNPPRKPSPKETASLSVSRATWRARAWLATYWPYLFFGAMTFLVAIAFDTQTAFVFVAGLVMGPLLTKAWA